MPKADPQQSGMTRGDGNIPGVARRRGLPRQFNALARSRLLKARREEYLAKVRGVPTEAQIAMVESLARLEWAALAAEHDRTLAALREAREHRRLLLKVMADFELSLTKPEP